MGTAIVGLLYLIAQRGSLDELRRSAALSVAFCLIYLLLAYL
jgi:hypothetical protein